MSEQTKQDMDDAIKAHMASEMDGALMVDYIVAAFGVSSNPDSEDKFGYMYECSESNPHSITGLANYAVDYFSQEEE